MDASKWDRSGRRWPPDLQQVLPAGYCAQCGGEIYPGEKAWTDCPTLGCQGGVDLHSACLLDWIRDQGEVTAAQAFGFRPAC